MTGDELGVAAQRVRDGQVAAAVAEVVERIAATLRSAAAGRREYADPMRCIPAFDGAVAFLDQEAATLEAAARVAEGDLGPLYGWLPSRLWTDEMTAALDGGEASSALGDPAFEQEASNGASVAAVSRRKPLDAYLSDQTGPQALLRGPQAFSTKES